MISCAGGAPVDSCVPGPPAPSDPTCDRVDDDCDGRPDDDYLPPPTTCGVGTCAGNSGNLIWRLGALVDTCNPVAGSDPELCDGLDNDCDGSTDEGDPEGGRDCGAGDPGQCAAMATRCSGGLVVCEPRTGAPPEVAADLAFADPVTLTWTASAAASAYDLHRGTLSRAASDWSHACRLGGLAGPPAADPDEPPAGALFYYLLAARNACGAGPLGRTAEGDPRPDLAPCL
jgi:hypothetical protein